MNTIPKIQEYILNPLDDYLTGKTTEKDVDWWMWKKNVSIARSINSTFLRDALKPYYHRLFMAEKDFFRNGHSNTQVKEAMLEVIENEGDDAGHLFVELDLVKAAENWAEWLVTDNHQPYYFFMLMRTILHRDYKPDWNMMYAKLRQKLTKVKSFGNYKTHEMYCLLMGITMIELSSLSRGKKDDLLRLLQDRWQFNKYMYSVLINHIIGFRVDNFAALANFVCNKSYYPDLHWFYKAFKENFDKICLEKEIDRRSGMSVRELALMHMKKMEEIIKSTKPSTELDELYDIIFPNAINNLLRQSRPKTYEELEAAIDDLTIRYNNVLEQLAKAVKDVESEVITPEDLTEAFLRFPRDMALTLFGSVSNLLTQNKTWQKYAPTIQEQILNKKEEPKSLTVNVQGDYVVEKKVENEVKYVSAGGTGICTNKRGKE